MLTAHGLASALALSKELERTFRQEVDGAREDLAERDQALIAGRQATALRKSLETWIGVRATRAALLARA